MPLYPGENVSALPQGAAVGWKSPDTTWNTLLDNATAASSGYTNTSSGAIPRNIILETLPIIVVICYALICVIGLLGNGLVIYVVVMYSKMKTVTNMYILNLAVADVLFLVSMPFLMTTTILRYWVFGFAMCKIYFVLVSINYFTGVFTLTAMSADRYLAVCHPVMSVTYRNSKVSLMVCIFIWSFSVLIMLPVILYSTTIRHRLIPGGETCTISWPENQPIPPDKAFTWYCFLLSYAIPVALISVFYILVIVRLRSVGPVKKSKEKKKSHRKVTKMVLTVIGMYVVCWLPYWIFQVDLTFKPPAKELSVWKILLFNAFTVLTFANSMFNPFLYNFLSESFRKSFMKAFKCMSRFEANKSMNAENIVYARNSHPDYTRTAAEQKYELTSLNTCMTSVKMENAVSTETQTDNYKALKSLSKETDTD